jgi:PPOX class probable F420-dependent enzyme
MTPDEARRRFAMARMGRLATADTSGRPHLVPLVFAISGDIVVSAVDHKPKRTTALRRLDNIEVNSQVTMLVDEYSEDWDELWWARADGSARVLDPASTQGRWAIDLLVARYPQYRDRRPGGPVVAVDVLRWSGWSADGSTAA